MLQTMIGDLRILFHLLRGHPRGNDHRRNLHAFYAHQAADYDRFRERLLPGRQALIEALDLQPGECLVELGAGTGRNIEWLSPVAPTMAGIHLVDLCEPLLQQARDRWGHLSNVHCHVADASLWQPPEPADVVVLAYALTMMPDWRKTLDHAWNMLRPGGRLAIVDFTITADQNRLQRAFWKRWFAHDGVRLDLEHLPSLMALAPKHQCTVERTRLPYLPGSAVPYYCFIGCKPQ